MNDFKCKIPHHVSIRIILMTVIHWHKTDFNGDHFNGSHDVIEVIGGWIFQSMALLADGWHMSSHMLALGLAYFAYRAAALCP